MRQTQKIFFWLIASWLVLCIGIVASQALSIQWMLPHHLSILGLLVIGVGVLLMLRDIVHFPPPRPTARLVLLSIACAAAWSGAAAWLLFFRIWNIMQVSLGSHSPWKYYRSIYLPRAGILFPELLWNGFFSLFCPWPATVIAVWLSLLVAAVLVLAYLTLRRRWRDRLTAWPYIRRWVLLLSAALALVLFMDRYGHEGTRRGAVYVNMLCIGDGWGPCTGVHVDPVLQEVPFAGSPAKFAPMLCVSCCYRINNKRFVICSMSGSGYLLREVGAECPYTAFRLESVGGKVVGTVAPLRIEFSSPLRHIRGPWYECWADIGELKAGETMEIYADDPRILRLHADRWDRL